MKSIFNAADKTPSMHVYMLPNRIYRFKDFSTGKGGDGVDLVAELIAIEKQLPKAVPAADAVYAIVTEYNQFIASGGVRETRELKVYAKYKVNSFLKRQWNNLDQKYWTDYAIGSKLLESYNVSPLESYCMVKDEHGKKTEIELRGDNLYGYFRKDGTLYKVYQPKIRKKKFIKVLDYIQGTDQLKYQTPNLVICASLKDLMCLMSMGFTTIEAVAPDSENTPIPKNIIQSYLHKYKNVCTLFDNDVAGKKSMASYNEKYGLPGVTFDMEKDVADAVKKHGLHKTKLELYQALLKVLKTK